MRILADENFPRAVVDYLVYSGHDVLWARTRCPGAEDRKLLEFAESEARLLFTLDRDFAQIAAQRRVPLAAAGVVLFRIHPATAERVERAVRLVIESGLDYEGHLSTVSPDGIQMLRLRRNEQTHHS